MKKIVTIVFMPLILLISKPVFAQAVVVTSITAPKFLEMSTQTLATDTQMLAQLASYVQNVQYDYNTIRANKNIESDFSAFASIFSTVSNFMNNYVCTDCSPGAWNKQQYDAFDKGLCQNIAHILGTGSEVFHNIGDLAQDINAITHAKFSTMNPAQMAATQTQLMGALGTGIQQTNTLLQANMQMQTAAIAKTQLQDKDASIRGVNSMDRFGQGVKP